jgi:hypothetical protein
VLGDRGETLVFRAPPATERKPLAQVGDQPFVAGDAFGLGRQGAVRERIGGAGVGGGESQAGTDRRRDPQRPSRLRHSGPLELYLQASERALEGAGELPLIATRLFHCPSPAPDRAKQL